MLEMNVSSGNFLWHSLDVGHMLRLWSDVLRSVMQYEPVLYMHLMVEPGTKQKQIKYELMQVIGTDSVQI
jgi:hypothetical protein